MQPFFPLCCCRQYSIVWYAYHTIQYHIWYCIVWCGMVWYGRFFPPFAADWLTDKLSPSANARLFILTGTISAVMTIDPQLTIMTNKWPWSSSSVGDICGSVLTSRSATPCFHLKIPGKVASPSSSRKAFKWASSSYNLQQRWEVASWGRFLRTMRFLTFWFYNCPSAGHYIIWQGMTGFVAPAC